MAKTYQAKHFTGEQLDQHMNKVLTKEIAGRGLEVDGDGIMHSTVPGYSTLVYSYEHQGNKEIYITELDYSTGTFTSVAHGLSNDDVVVLTVDCPYNIGNPYQYIPTGLMLCSNYNSTTESSLPYYVLVVDEDHFQLSKTQGGDKVLYASKTTVDFTKFHFEMVPTNMELEIAELNTQECLIVVRGKIFNSFRWVRPTNVILYGDNGGNRTGGGSYDTTMGLDTHGSTALGCMGYNHLYGTLEIKMVAENQAYQNNNIDVLVYSSAMPYCRHTRQYFHMHLTSNMIEGIKMHGDLNGGFFNGTRVEVYTR